MFFSYMYATKKFNHDTETSDLKYKTMIKDSIAKIVAEKEEGDYFSLLHTIIKLEIILKMLPWSS